MKKRMVVIFLVALIVCLGALLVACDFGKNNSAANEKVTLQSGEILMAENSRYAEYFNDGEISLPAGVQADFSESDFVLKGKYSDGSTKKIAKFSIQVNRRSERLIVIDFVANQKTVAQLNVNTAFESVSPVKTDNLVIEYSGEAVNILDRLQLEDGTMISDMIAANKVALSEFSVTQGTNADVYPFQLCLAEGYVWVEGNQETRQIDLAWEITPKIVTIPTVIGTGSYVYDGTEKTLELDMHGFENVINFVNGDSDTRKGTDAGTYYCQVLLNTDARDNYAFGEGHTSSEAIPVATWTIAKKELPIPTVFGKQADERGLYHFTYTGESILPTLSVGDQTLSCTIEAETGRAVYDANHAVYTDGAVLMTITSFEVEEINALTGNESIKISDEEYIWYHSIELLIPTEYEANYKWKDSIDSRIVIKYCIDRADASLPEDFVGNFKLKYVYTGVSDELSGWNLKLSPNDYLGFLETGTCGVISQFYGGFMVSDDVKAYMQENGLAVYENVNLSLETQALGDNYEFCWAENASFGESGIAEAGQTYRLDLVYRKGRQDFSEAYNYNPITVSVEVEVVKGALAFSSTWAPYVYIPNYNTGYFTMGELPKPEFTTDYDGNIKCFVIEDNVDLGMNEQFAGKSVVSWYSATGMEGTYEPTDELSLPGYYRTTVTLLFDKTKYVSYYYRGDYYYLADTFTYDWEILKRKFTMSYGNLNTAGASLSWESAYYYGDTYSGNLCKMETSAEAITVKYRATENDEWEVINSYDPDVEGCYCAEVTVGYDHDKFVMYTEAEFNEETHEFTYTYGDVFLYEWER